MDMCPGVWPRLSTVPIPDTISAPGLIRVVRSVISLKAACVPGIMPRQRSGKEPWLDGGEICHVGARRAAADAIAVVARAMVGRKSLDSAATAGVTSACRASPDSARRPHGRPRCGPPPWRGFLVGRAERILRQQLAYLLTSIPLVHLVPSCGEVAAIPCSALASSTGSLRASPSNRWAGLPRFIARSSRSI
jgi:hypothetical protein